MSLSDILATDYFSQVKYHLPISKRSSNDSIEIWIKNSLSRYSKLFIDNNLGIYDDTQIADFYNINSLLNIRALNTIAETRWCSIVPVSFYCAKLTSCRLKDIIPTDTVLPVGVAYVDDIPITVTQHSQDVNGQVPSANTGLVGLLGGRKFMTALTLNMTDTGFTFSDIIQINAVFTYYRNVEYPDFSVGSADFIDILKKDAELVANYVVEEAYMPNKAPLPVAQAIQDREFQIIYGGSA